jgi:hypothetical protein
LAQTRVQASPARQKFIEWAVQYLRSHSNESIRQDQLLAAYQALPFAQRSRIDEGRVGDYFQYRFGIGLSMKHLNKLAFPVHGDESLDNAEPGSWEDELYDESFDGGGSEMKPAAAAAGYPIDPACTAAAPPPAAAAAAAPIDSAGTAAALPAAAAAADPIDSAGTAAASAAAPAPATAADPIDPNGTAAGTAAAGAPTAPPPTRLVPRERRRGRQRVRRRDRRLLLPFWNLMPPPPASRRWTRTRRRPRRPRRGVRRCLLAPWSSWSELVLMRLR